jgi:hypothetical protein
MKHGANFEDKNRIREWAAVGKSAQQISGFLNIDPECVAKHMPPTDVCVEEEVEEEIEEYEY